MYASTILPRAKLLNAYGIVPITWNPNFFHIAIAGRLVDTTILNCIDLNPRFLAVSRECSHILDAMPFPLA